MPEFNPVNEVAKKQYEEALLYARGRDPKTVRAVWNNINLFESFTGHADFRSFNADQAKSFRAWLEKRTNQKGELLSISTIRSTLNNVREFLAWLPLIPQYRNKIDGRAVQYLRLSDNANRAARASREKIPPTLEELEKALKAMPHESDIEKRDRAIFAFTIITCVRDDALVSLKIKDVDVENKVLWQNPRHVRTKRRKGIITGFVGGVMPCAEEIVMDWMDHALKVLQLKPNEPLFPKTLVLPNPEKMAFEVCGLSNEHWANAQPIRNIFKTTFNAVDLPYFNPHLIRNTICLWVQKHGSQHEYKALSQNIGHEDAMTTYNSYSRLSQDEQLEVVAGIGKGDADLLGVSTEALMVEFARRVGKGT